MQLRLYVLKEQKKNSMRNCNRETGKEENGVGVKVGQI